MQPHGVFCYHNNNKKAFLSDEFISVSMLIILIPMLLDFMTNSINFSGSIPLISSFVLFLMCLNLFFLVSCWAVFLFWFLKGFSSASFI